MHAMNLTYNMFLGVSTADAPPATAAARTVSTAATSSMATSPPAPTGLGNRTRPDAPLPVPAPSLAADMAAMLKAAEGRAAASTAIRAETKAAADYSERAREGREEARELAREERDKASERARVERDVAREQRDHEERGELRKALVDSPGWGGGGGS